MRHRLTMMLMTVVAVLTLAVPAIAGPWVNNVSGGGEDSYPGSEGSPTFHISFNTRVDALGNAEGSVDWRLLDGTVMSYGSVDCVAVRDNRAAIVYTADGGLPGYGTPGVQVAFVVEDNGNSRDAPLDRHSFIYGTVGDNCIAFLDYYEGVPLEVEWIRGDIQIR